MTVSYEFMTLNFFSFSLIFSVSLPETPLHINLMDDYEVSSSSVVVNYPLISAFVAFLVAQSIKFFSVWLVSCFIAFSLLRGGNSPARLSV